MTTYYKATFSDGRTIKRSTLSRTYTHAWRTGQATGFSGSHALADKAKNNYAASYPNLVREVAEAVEITAKEYRALPATEAS